MNFLAICGHSGSGKTTSLLYFINQNREHFNIFYINCFTLSRKDLNNEKIKHILIEELRMAVNNGVWIVNKFILYLDEVFQKRNKSDNNFIFGIIKKIIDIYNDETFRKIKYSHRPIFFQI
jgi:Cdc6-like AAA superfamily ATPase